MREVFRTAGSPIVFTAASKALRFETAANSVVAMPSLQKRDFSARRSCAASSPAGRGTHKNPPPEEETAAAATSLSQQEHSARPPPQVFRARSTAPTPRPPPTHPP